MIGIMDEVVVSRDKLTLAMQEILVKMFHEAKKSDTVDHARLAYDMAHAMVDDLLQDEHAESA